MSMWIQSQASLRDHPKLFALMGQLGIGRPQAIGHLHLLWLWACDYADDGILTKFTAQQLARAADWPDEPKKLVDALVQSGFLDRLGDNALSIHNWDEHRLYYLDWQQRVEKTREQVRERVRAHRARKRAGYAAEAPSVTVGNGGVTPPPTPTTTGNADKESKSAEKKVWANSASRMEAPYGKYP